MNIQPTQLQGIFLITDNKKQYYATQNLTPGQYVSTEKIIAFDNKEYRIIDPKISKLGSAIHKGIKQLPIKPTDVLLYLGASSGTTTSHFSDILGKTGFIFAVEYARRMCTQLVFLAQQRSNIAPIFEDAAQPEKYMTSICQADFIYQDISQRNQVDIFLLNCNLFLKKGGFSALCLKARSIDVRKKPEIIFAETAETLKEQLIIVDQKILSPYQKDHMFFLCKKK